MHRIGRAGRFGVPGLALNIYDRPEDEVYLNDILEHYSMKDKMKELKNEKELKDLLEELKEKSAAI